MHMSIGTVVGLFMVLLPVVAAAGILWMVRLTGRPIRQVPLRKANVFGAKPHPPRR